MTFRFCKNGFAEFAKQFQNLQKNKTVSCKICNFCGIRKTFIGICKTSVLGFLRRFSYKKMYYFCTVEGRIILKNVIKFGIFKS